MSGRHRSGKLNPLPKRQPGKAGAVERKAAQDTASKGGGKVVDVTVRRNEKH